MSHISSDTKAEEKDIKILDSTMHYTEQGSGDPILFIHGMPTHSFLWRNITPRLAEHGRCIAVDLIGMGKSGCPDIEYSVTDHINYLTAFIKELKLTNVTLVMHAWGSVPGFSYAMDNQSNVKGLAFMEAHIRPVTNHDDIALPVQQWVSELPQSENDAYKAITEENYFIDHVLMSGSLRELSEKELSAYRTPFEDKKRCKALWQYVQELPMGAEHSVALDLIATYSKYLTESKIPKLMFYGIPGFNTTIDTVQWAKDSFSNLKQIEVESYHYLPEAQPEIIRSELDHWYKNL